MRKLFGTDGIRGTANCEPMTAETALKVAMAAGQYFTRGPHRHIVVIGKDTRLSGYMIESALTAGFTSVGMDVVLVGPLPTPAVAMLTRSLRADLGVVVSASHNPYQDNGIKLFGPDGYKLSDEVEWEIESRIGNGAVAMPPSNAIGRAKRLDDALGRYIEFVKGSFPRGHRLDGLKIVVDCAHGAAYKAAPTVLWELGAEVVSIGVEPDGLNINEACGATATAALERAVVEQKADFGIALDGDADRVVMVDEKGHRLDGDQLMGLIAQTWKAQGRLKGGGIVATVMSNLGLERYLAGHGLGLVRTQVGDRYVVETMRAEGYNVGGEQSGHIILTDYATTGDGLVAALQILASIVDKQRPASEVVRVFEPMPQCLKNVRVNGTNVLESTLVKGAVRDMETALGQRGRILIRKSGTEPVVRVMVEGEDEALVGQAVDTIVDAIQQAAH